MTIDPRTGLPKKTVTAAQIQAAGGLSSVLGLSSFTGFVPGFSTDPAGKIAVGTGPAPRIDVGGFTPDYRSLIDADPGYLQLKGDLSASGIADQSQRDAAIRRAITQFGFAPDFSHTDLGFDASSLIDPTTRALAEENTRGGLSTQARLDQAHTDAVRNITNALAARGTLHSGETGFQLGRENQAHAQSQYDSTQKLLDYISGVQAAFAQNAQQRAMALGQGASAAADRQASLPQNQPRGQVAATFGGYGPDGQPFYLSPDGKKWNLDGTPYDSAPPPPPAVPPAFTLQPGERPALGHSYPQ